MVAGRQEGRGREVKEKCGELVPSYWNGREYK